MDLITHGIMGAALAQCGFHKSLGRRAVLYGALGAMLPDLDVISDWIAGPIAGMKYHRWISHSLWFGPLIGTLLGWLISRKSPHLAFRKQWIALFILTLTTHPLLDLFTSYGTQLWAPFSDQRCALDAISIIDLRYTGPLLVACIAGFLLKKYPNLVQKISILAFIFSVSYLSYGVKLNQDSRTYAQAQWTYPLDHLRSYPTLFQPYLRHMVARTGPDICVGYLLVPDPQGKIQWQCAPQLPHPDAQTLLQTPVGQRFAWFTSGDYRAEVLPNGLIRFHDLRYPLYEAPLVGMWGVEGSCSPAPLLNYYRHHIRFTTETFAKIRRLWQGRPPE